MKLSKGIYTMQGLQIAAQVFASRAEVLLSEDEKSWEIELKARRKGADKKALEGEFMNELLNQEYRFAVGKFNHKVTSLIVTQTLLAARGGENPPAPTADSPELKALADKLVREAEEEARRTMPRKIAPQGTVLPPAPEESNV